MITTSTHDTKRSEDVRTRIDVLSEIPLEWREAVWRWAGLNESLRRDGLPDRNTEYLLYQTLIGAWPIDAERLTAYMLKACREAKIQTSWIAPNEAFESALDSFAREALKNAQFVADFERFLDRLKEPARINSLAQVLIKLTAPGVPDIYQGCEIWDFSLVDPDNRRPVDYALRRRLLSSLHGLSIEELYERSDEGLPKLFLTQRTLAARREFSESFGPKGTYAPLPAEGAGSGYVTAFKRGEDVITVAQRLPLQRGGNWANTSIKLPPGSWRNRLTDEWVASEEVMIDELLRRFPVALLTREDRH